MFVHLVARAAHWRPFLDWELASRTWRALRLLFPLALAAMLMPNHLHLLADVLDEKKARVSLAHTLAALTRAEHRAAAGALPRWEPVPKAEVIKDPKRLVRLARYTALNPCRARLVHDPLEWAWSTHRDVVGGVADPWIAPARLAELAQFRLRAPADFPAEWHAYVSGDPTCEVGGTPPPISARPSDLPAAPLERIARAAAAATRLSPEAIRERTPARLLFVQLAGRQGWRDPATLARACGVTPEAVRQLRARDGGDLVAAGELCLGDDRLLRAGIEGMARIRT